MLCGLTSVETCTFLAFGIGVISAPRGSGQLRTDVSLKQPLSWGSSRQKVSREGAHICPYTRIDMLLIKLSLRRYHRDHGNKGNNLSRPFSLADKLSLSIRA